MTMESGAARPSLAVDIQLKGHGQSLADEVQFAQQAEDVGVSRIWYPEGYREALLPLAAMAQSTNRIGLGTCVAQWTRTLPNMELAAANLKELSNDRFILGLGTMPKAWNEDWHGIRYERPLRRMREYVTALRLMWQSSIDAPVDFDGEVFKVRNYYRFDGPLDGQIPIFLGATLPRMTRLAGAIADGVLFNTIISPEYMSAVLKGHLESGVEESNRDSYPVLCMNAVTVCTEDEAKAYAILKADLAMHIGVTTYWTEIARFHGFEKAYAAVEKSWHAGDYQRAADLVPDEAVEVFGLIGSPADIDKQLDRYRSLFDRVILAGPGFNASGESASAVYDGMLALFGSDYVD